MATATATLNGQLDKLIASIHKHRVKVADLKRERAAYIAETEGLRAEYGSRCKTHPEELARGGRPFPDTEAARLLAVVSPRMQGAYPAPDPELEEKFNKAVAELHEAQALERQFRLVNTAAIVAEVEPPMDGVTERVTGAADQMVAALNDYRVNAAGVLDFIYATTGLDGSHLVTDQRITRWLEVAEEMLNDPLVTPHIGEMGQYRLDQARQSEAKQAVEDE